LAICWRSARVFGATKKKVPASTTTVVHPRLFSAWPRRCFLSLSLSLGRGY
jgi:hypothetical protein